MTARRALLAALALFAALLAPGSARAHQTSVVYLRLRVQGRDAELSARIAAADLGEPTGHSPLQPPTRAQALAAAGRVSRYVAERVHVRNGEAACPPAAVDLPARVMDRPAEASFDLTVTVRYACARQIDDLRVHDDLFFDLDPTHQGLAEIDAFGATRTTAFRADARDARVLGEPSRAAQFRDYFTLGVAHIFTGYDHVAFLLGLLLIAGGMGARRGVRYALGVVTAFTAAHSLTLIAAALGLVRLPARAVETAIAVSILYVALENLRAREPRHRWALTFGFGLVHGFGFASVLRELGLPRSGMVLSLLSFNLGVEAGQLGVVAAAFPLLLLARRARWGPGEIALACGLCGALCVVLPAFGVPRETVAVVAFGGTALLAVAAARRGYERGARRVGSAVIALFALLWIAERVSGHALLGGALG